MTNAAIDTAIDRAPPQNYEAEQAALGAALLDAGARAIVLRDSAPEDYLDPRHGRLRAFLADVITPSLEPGGKPDVVTVVNALADAGELEAVGGRDYLVELCSVVPIIGNAAAYCRIIRGKSEQRQARDAAIETLRTTGLQDPATDDTPLTDLGNSIRFARKAAGKARYVGAWGKWILWTGQRWQADDAAKILTLAKGTARGIYDECKDAGDPDRQRALAKWAIRSQARERLAAMVDLTRPDLAVDVEALDADPFAFNVRNGTLDLRTGQLRPHRPKDLITRQAAVRFDPAATCPLWDTFLDRILGGNAALIGYLQRYFGLCLTADIGEQILVILFGPGANGKSVLLDTVAAILGEYASEAPPGLLTVSRGSEHPTSVADLCGRRLVIASETDEGRRLRVQLVKTLTGNARLKARFMRADFFEFPRTHKLILATNNKPIISETSHAIWRRIRLLPFEVVISPAEQDRRLTAKLVKEGPGILNWLLAGCLDWQRDGLNEPAEVLAATAAYESEQDPLAEFLDGRCVLGPGVEVTRADLFGAYIAWAEEAKDRHPLDRASFYERIRRRPGIEDAQRRLDGRMTRLFAGIGLLQVGVPRP